MLENMTLRGLSSRSALLLCFFILLTLLGLYSHNNTTKLLNKNRIDFVKLSEQKDAIDAELQVAVEQQKDCTNQLQKVASDLKINKKELDELKITLSKLEHEVTSRTQEHNVEVKDLQSQLKKAQDDYDTLQQKTQQDHAELEAERKKVDEMLKKTQQERDSEVQTLKDNIADLSRKNLDLSNALQRVGVDTISKNKRVVKKEDIAQQQVENPNIKKLPKDSNSLYPDGKNDIPINAAVDDPNKKDVKKDSLENKPVIDDPNMKDVKKDNLEDNKPVIDDPNKKDVKKDNLEDNKPVDGDLNNVRSDEKRSLPPPPAVQPIKDDKNEAAAGAANNVA